MCCFTHTELLTLYSPCWVFHDSLCLNRLFPLFGMVRFPSFPLADTYLYFKSLRSKIPAAGRPVTSLCCDRPCPRLCHSPWHTLLISFTCLSFPPLFPVSVLYLSCICVLPEVSALEEQVLSKFCEGRWWASDWNWISLWHVRWLDYICLLY